jgi:tetratricopeptide (TPR) repeat protein
VKIEVSDLPKTAAVNQIDYIQFDEEPVDLTKTRTLFKAGKLDEALESVEKVKASELKSDELKQDVAFYKAILLARKALAGKGSTKDAGTLLFEFEAKNKDSYHYLEAAETLGDMLIALGKFDNAENYYAKLSTAPWPDYRMRSGVLIGRALEAQEKFDKALAKYDEVLAMDAEGADAEKQRLAASLGKATALAATGHNDEAVKSIEEIVSKADADDAELHARAYVALGNCYLAAKQPKDALLAFLHVDILYPTFAEQHAEALANLSDLWKTVDKSDRAKQAHDQLLKRYPNSPWASK